MVNGMRHVELCSHGIMAEVGNGAKQLTPGWEGGTRMKGQGQDAFQTYVPSNSLSQLGASFQFLPLPIVHSSVNPSINQLIDENKAFWTNHFPQILPTSD